MAVRFDGSGDRLKRTTGLPANATPTSISGWANLRADRAGVFRYFFGWEMGAGPTEWMLCGWHNTLNVLEFTGTGGSHGNTLRWDTGSFTGRELNNWFWFAWSADVPDGGYWRGYAGKWGSKIVQGYDFVGTLSLALCPDFAPTGLFIGSSSWDTEWSNISIANIKIWTQPLSLPELQKERYTYRPQRTEGLWAWYPLHSHTDIKDYSGNGKDLTAEGTLTTEVSPQFLRNNHRGRLIASKQMGLWTPKKGVLR